MTIEECMDVIDNETENISGARNDIDGSMSMIRDKLFDIIDILENSEEYDEEEKKEKLDQAKAALQSVDDDGELGSEYIGDMLEVLFDFVN